MKTFSHRLLRLASARLALCLVLAYCGSAWADSQQIALRAGWNLFSLAVEPADPRVEVAGLLSLNRKKARAVDHNRMHALGSARHLPHYVQRNVGCRPSRILEAISELLYCRGALAQLRLSRLDR